LSHFRASSLRSRWFSLSMFDRAGVLARRRASIGPAQRWMV